MEELKKEYATQDNRATAYPIYVTVQELFCVGVMGDGYGVSCPHGDGETKTEFKHSDYEESFDSIKELMEKLAEDDDCIDNHKSLKEALEEIEEINAGYIWVDIEFFLTIKGAKEFMAADGHNHGQLRTYVKHFNRRNCEMRNFLKEAGFKTKD